MSIQRPIVLVTEGSDPAPLEWLAQHADIRHIPYDHPDFTAQLLHAQGLVIRTYTRITPDFLDRAPNLRCIARGGVGLENINLPACRQRGITVVYTPDANTLAVGDFVFGAILQLIRPWNAFKDHAYTPAEFKKIRSTVRGRQLNELTIGILGMGRVGKRVGHLASGFGMRILYNDLLEIPPLAFAATHVDKETLYRQSDILSLHITMQPGNENLISRDQLSLMKPDAILINTSRGEVLDAHALADALRNKRLGGAAIDVYWPEPPPADFPLIGIENTLLTPHLAARTNTALENMSWVVRDLLAVLNGQAPQYPAT